MKPAMHSFRLRDVGVALALALIATGCGSGDDEQAVQSVPTKAVTRGPMRVTVTAGGALASARPVRVVNEMEGKATILYLVPEGTAVKEGDVIVRLDSSTLRDNLNRQEVDLETSRTKVKTATEKHEIQLNKNESDIKKAEVEAELAKADYTVYMEGTYMAEKGKQESALLIAEEELKRALDRVQWSQRLAEKKFITRTELEADQLKAKKAEVDVALAKNALRVLDEFEYPKQQLKLSLQRDEASKELERVKRRASAESAQTLAERETAKKTLQLEEERYARTKSNLEKSVIRAPSTGIVVYARQDRGRMGSEPITEGKTLNEREEILQIPDNRRMNVDMDVHESQVKKVRPGQPVRIRLDAMSGREFTGVVASVAAVPSTSNSWMNPDLKLYPTKVEIKEELEDLRPGMNAQCEIFASDLGDVLQVPMQAIHSAGGKTFAYVQDAAKPVLREVKIGQNNDRAVQIVDGLKEGEQVYLAVPPEAPPLPEKEERSAPSLPPEAMQPPTEGGAGGGQPEGAPRGGARPGAGRRGNRGQGSPSAPPADGTTPVPERTP